MDIDTRIRMEVKQALSPLWKAERALDHKYPEPTDTSVFDHTYFGERLACEDQYSPPMNTDDDDAEQEEINATILSIRQRDANP